jgi:hypothetical protein
MWATIARLRILSTGGMGRPSLDSHEANKACPARAKSSDHTKWWGNLAIEIDATPPIGSLALEDAHQFKSKVAEKDDVLTDNIWF